MYIFFVLYFAGFFLQNCQKEISSEPNKVPHVYLNFERSFEPFQEMADRPVSSDVNSNGCLDDVAWNEYYVYDVCVATTCPLTDYAIERSTDYARSDAYSLRFSLKPTPLDKWPMGEATHRAELRPNAFSPIARYPKEGEERWYGLSVLFPEDFIFAPATLASDLRFSIAQWQHGSEGSPILAIEVYGDKLAVARSSGISTQTEWLEPQNLADIKRGEWLDLVIQIKWSRSEGAIAVWVDEQKYYEVKNVPTIYRDLDNGGGYKVGLYYWRWQYRQTVQDAFNLGITEREIFIDELREYLGVDGYSAVVPGNRF
ncbi:MAG: hypothetical protein HKN76_17825 [Saprospiraceae bacterium]|nr:hypothetical protein [Saprospiraceae bacterium]